jgi:hypothetical protein
MSDKSSANKNSSSNPSRPIQGSSTSNSNNNSNNNNVNGNSVNNVRTMNFIQAQIPNNSRNVRPAMRSANNSTGNIQTNSTNNTNNNNNNSISSSNDFMALFNSTSGPVNRSGSSGNEPTLNFLNSVSSSNPNTNSNTNTSTSSASNTNPMSRLETIRQYYVQLSNNLRLITQQLQAPDLSPSRRQALLMEQGRANAAMQEFTEKILKPISASKQQQQQQQQQQQNLQQQNLQQQQQIRYSQSQNQQSSSQQANQFQNSRPPLQNPSNKYSSIPVSTSQQAPNVNLYSQSGLGMIRPIINSGNPSSANIRTNNMSSTSTSNNISINPSTFRPLANSPIVSATSPQRPFRPNAPQQINQAAFNLSSPLNVSGNNFPQQNNQQQQLIVDRQSYLMAAQQHQNSISQQQLMFQQRLSLFSRDHLYQSPPQTASNTNNTSKRKLFDSSSSFSPTFKRFKNKAAPVLALPPVSVPSSSSSSAVLTGRNNNFLLTTSPATSALPTASFGSSKNSSLPLSYANQLKLQDLANMFNLSLSSGAENFLLRVADEFIDNLARKSFTFASHRLNSKKRAALQLLANNSKTSKKGTTAPPPPQLVQVTEELNLTVEDLILGMDELVNYQIAGSGSISNCRPVTRRTPSSTTSTSNNTSDSTTTGSILPSSVSNHQHRVNMVKKHSALFQNY